MPNSQKRKRDDKNDENDNDRKILKRQCYEFSIKAMDSIIITMEKLTINDNKECKSGCINRLRFSDQINSEAENFSDKILLDSDISQSFPEIDTPSYETDDSDQTSRLWNGSDSESDDELPDL